MRVVSIVSMLASTAFSATLAAQQFEGVIQSRVFLRGRAVEQTLQVKGDQWRQEGQDRGQRGTLVSDRPGRVISIVDERKMYIVMADEAPDRADAAYMPKMFESTGRSENIAGYACQDYKVTMNDGGILDECITTALGFVGVVPGVQAAPPALRQQFPQGFMVLKSARDGKPRYEVEHVERKSLPASLFEPPAGYKEVKMPTAGGVLRRP